jgi:putative endonuclease
MSFIPPILSLAQRRRKRGESAEALAASHLQRHGLRLLARNFRVRDGEIDLICEDGRQLVFVEVRLRSNSAYGGAAASITHHKQRRIILAAQHFLMSNPAYANRNARFDCILLDQLSTDHLEWIRDAFSAD